ncbi:hypothetical protein D3C83_23970 [compost metagenome]
MHLEHDLRGLFPAQREKLLQDPDDEIHRRVVVVQQQHLEHRRRLDLGLFRLEDRVFALPIRHAGNRR